MLYVQLSSYQNFKISFEFISHYLFVLATTKNLHTCVCFYVNIRLMCVPKRPSFFNLKRKMKNELNVPN